MWASQGVMYYERHILNSAGTLLVLLTCAAIQSCLLLLCIHVNTLCGIFMVLYVNLFEARLGDRMHNQRTTMALRINFLWYNRVVFRQQSPSLWQKTGPICLVLVSLMAGWQVDETGMNCKFLKTLYKLNYWDSYFIKQQCNVIIKC